MTRSTFSTTTMASSTRRPIAKTIANMVSMLMENPRSPRIAKVPRSTTGTAMVGIRVARMFPRKTYMTRKTNKMASNRVLTTSSMATLTKGVVSNGYITLMPAGKYLESSTILALTASAVASALAPRRQPDG